MFWIYIIKYVFYLFDKLSMLLVIIVVKIAIVIVRFYDSK
jgi:hypothetical protein